MRIPEIRAAMLAEAKSCGDLMTRARLIEWEQHLHRRAPVRMAPRHCRAMTEDRTEAIRAYAASHPSAGYQTMSKIFDVSVGRISEALAGKRS